MNEQKDFWRGKKVLVTGHTGFKGSWLSLWLQKLGAELVGFALEPPTEPSLFEAAQVAQGMVASVIGDVRDGEHLQDVMQTHQPEIVFHLAAQPLVRYSYQAPIETISTNVMGTANMLEAVRHTDSVRVVVSITSDKCYENREWHWGYREVDALGGHDPYSASKAAAELVIATFRNSYFAPAAYQQHGVAVASTRAGNVIGGGDWAMDRLLPDIMRALMVGEPVIIRSPRATRPWQHVLEPLSGYIKLAECLSEDGAYFAKAWNFGPNDEDVKPVSWIVEYVTKIWGDGASWQLDGADQPHENTFLKLDCSLAKNQLGWLPRLNLAMALDWIVEWFQGYQQQQDMRALTEQQISRYESEAKT